MLDGVSVVRSEKVKNELILDGNDIELVSRSCALIKQDIHLKSAPDPELDFEERQLAMLNSHMMIDLKIKGNITSLQQQCILQANCILLFPLTKKYKA
ncbi:hypothetical protein RIF29_04799 [Crotalaria pallida]|uniref:Uncharacterized protein n=1 Tax=Crotalaria pallida TaxID=3830 RepID=A0AAN9J1C8_CROPI